MTLSDTTADFTVMPQAMAGLETRAAGSEELVYDPPSGRVHVLNATAARVLARCDGATTLAQVVGELVAATHVDPARAERDIIRVCGDFRAKGLLR
jgi:PqqD family protein of HPr-rel-A system